MWFLFAIISSITFGLSAFLMKYNSYKKWSVYHLLFGIYTSGFISFFLLVLSKGHFNVSLMIIFFSLILGIGTTFGNLMYMKALNFGPASLTSPLVNVSVVLVVLMSIFLYNEELGLMEISGITLIILASSLLPFDPGEKLSINNKVWYLYLLIATFLFFLRNGGLKITEEFSLNNTILLMNAYLFGFLWYGGCISTKKIRLLNKKEKLKGLYCGLVTGIFSFLGMQFYSIALTSGPASIVSPIFAAHTLIVVILSILMLHERLTKLQTLTLTGIFIGILILRI